MFPQSTPENTVFAIQMPNVPNDTIFGIGFIVDKSYNKDSNIKVLQDTVLTVINNNPNANYAYYSEYDRCTYWIEKYLNETFKIPKEKIKKIEKKKHSKEDCKCKYFTGSLSLKEYREVIAAYPLDSLYVFTDNPRSDTIRELVRLSKESRFRVYTIDCEGTFIDYSDPENSMSEPYFVQGGYFNECVKTDQRRIFRQRPPTGKD